jgi:mono/diheme cytochrome c family protein
MTCLLITGIALGRGMMCAATGVIGDPTTVLLPDDTAVVEQGPDLYASHCAAFHGSALEGKPDWRSCNADGRMRAPPQDASGHTWHHDGATLFQLTKVSVAEIVDDPGYQSDMPAFADILTDAEIVTVLSYIKSTWPLKLRESHDRL